MKHIHFAIRPYRNSNNEISAGWIRLVLIADDGILINSQDIRSDAWRNNESDCRAYWKHQLLTGIRKHLRRASDAKGYIYDREHTLLIEDEAYDEWYRWYYYIDGEDAYAYISRCGASQHTTHWQSRCGVIAGWTFYKKLREHDFNESTAAMLAYARGYLAGMESNSPWDSEGMEALHCLGLDIEGGSDALRRW